MKLDEIATNSNIMFIIALVSLIVGVLGLVGVIYTIMSYRSQKRTEHAYEHILNEANREWQGRFTEDEINKLNEQLKVLTKQIDNGIPQKAQKALLEYKEENLRRELEEIYKDYNRVKKELEEIEIKSKLDPEIEASINKEINNKMGKSFSNHRLLIIIAIILLFSIPSVYEVFYRFSNYVIWLTGANLTVSLLSFYVIVLVAVTLLLASFKFSKISLWIVRNKKKSIIISILLLLGWIVACYLVTYDIIIVPFIIQMLIAFISIFLFGFAFVIIKKLLIR